MASKLAYVLEQGEVDLSRWLQISGRQNGMCMLHLSELCQPGRLSSLGNVMCDRDSLRAAAEGGTLQLTLRKGYVLIRRGESLLTVEFKSHDDATFTKVSLNPDDVLARLAELDQPLSTSI